MPTSYKYKYKPKRGAARYVTVQRTGKPRNSYSSNNSFGNGLIDLSAKILVELFRKK